ncbi:MAG: zf-TFIIB domain-containing protein [Ignavibacteriaceae bacterium]|nr:zf-TFIIB domain-containing protein [Ignavibacteriaceae bacterium]
MICPVCKESMVILELNEVEIDFCAGCNGIWLDSGELELLLEDIEEREKLLGTLTTDPAHLEKPYHCPICKKKMEKVHVGENKDVLIDRCAKGHGLWFDKGELKAVLEMGADEENKVLNLLKEMFENKLSSN